MYGRPTILFPLALLALLALFTFWMQRTVQPPTPKLDGSNRHDPDYILNNFVTTKADINGNLHYRLTATEMKHYPDDDSTELQRPHISRYDPGKPYTEIEGQRGFVSSNGEIIQFLDNVKVVRHASKNRGEMVVLTEFLTIEPKKNLVTTDRPVVITQAPKTVIHAIGMVYDKKQQTVKLLNNVKVHYERPGLAKTPQTANSQSNKKMKTDKASTSYSTKNKSKNSPAKDIKKKATKKLNNTRIRRQYEQAASPP